MQIKIKLKEKNIQDIKINDCVLSKNKKGLCFNKVNNTFSPIIKKENQVKISLSSGLSFVSSDTHKMMVNNDWKEVKNISVEDTLVSEHDKNSIVTSVDKYGIEDEQFYDIEVDKTSCYFIGNDGNYVLSHNSATVFFPFWHYEIEDILVLKNNAGTDDNRVRKLDYGIQFSELFYKRVKEDKDITLFSPHEVPELYDNFGLETFDEIYEAAERKHLKQKKKIKARKLLEVFTRERLETGRYYIMNIDHCNEWPWMSHVTQSNLCMEITHPTKPLTKLEDENAEIGTCVLAGINICETKDGEYKDVCDIIVRMLDGLIDEQDYPIKATENFTTKKRALGVGISNVAAYLAKNKTLYTDKAALTLIDDICEKTQYHLLLASNELAKEKGRCEDFDESCYSAGKFPFERRVDYIDEVVPFTLEYDWESLRASIKEYGLRHCTLTCCQPFESSSVIQNSTNGIEPPRALLCYKKSKMGALPQLVPFLKYKNYYQLAWDIPNSRLSEIAGVIQKWFDMSISLNHYYDYTKYEKQEIPLSELIKDMFYLYKMGCKSLYYTNSKDEDEEIQEESCVGGACSI